MDKKRKAAVCLLLHELSKRSKVENDFTFINWHLQTSLTLMSLLATTAACNKNEHIRIFNFYEEWIDLYLESDFFAHFRMCRKNVSLLLFEIGHELNKTKSLACIKIPLEKSLLMTLWYLAKGETLFSTADRFGVATSTCYEHCFTNIKILSNLSKKFIRWPTQNECSLIASQFLSISDYPYIIGAIDGCHINCKVPEDQQESYTNRKMGYSIILQGICTKRKLFTSVCIGFPGSVHDARVLKESGLYHKIVQYGKDQYFYGDQYHLVGDSAYPCIEWLMTPYRDTGRLTLQQKKHITSLSKARVVIENTYALLKGRWRILKFVDAYSIEKITYIISACCTLHNFCLQTRTQ